MLDYNDFLNRVIDDGIQAAKNDYKREDQQAKLHGAVAGFAMCRLRGSVALGKLLAEARKSTIAARREGCDSETYWFKRCYELEIEWVCNVVSAMLVNQGLPAIIPPTYRGLHKAAQVLGVQSKL